MRKVIGIGETILDILFKNNQPFNAVPGGSTFNCMISLSRCNIPSFFISELGNDKVGNIIKDFMAENNLSSEYIDFFSNGNSPVSLAFLNEGDNAEYIFYKKFPERRLEIDLPKIDEDDIVVFGSYYAVNPILHEKVQTFLEYAKERKAIIYYDINFRKAHAHEAMKLMPVFMDNFEYADIIRCSDEDLSNIYPNKSIDEIYKDHIEFYCKNFIVTQGEKGVTLFTGKIKRHYEVPQLQPKSTIGAGDNFNAGLIYGFIKNEAGYNHMIDLDENKWDKLIGLGIDFASEVCCSFENYVSVEFAGKQK